MKTRQWQQIERLASLDAFLLWILEQPDTAHWHRGEVCLCPLHDFIVTVTGATLIVNSPELVESWAGSRATQRWPTPGWMVWIIRSVDRSDHPENVILKDELLFLALLMVRRDFDNPIMSPEELAQAGP
jgi:hypothetical protein